MIAAYVTERMLIKIVMVNALARRISKPAGRFRRTRCTKISLSGALGLALSSSLAAANPGSTWEPVDPAQDGAAPEPREWQSARH